MSKIKVYPRDLMPDNGDKVIGTRASDNRTLNYTLLSIANYLSMNGYASPSRSSLTLRYNVLVDGETQPTFGSAVVVGETDENINLSSISSLKVSYKNNNNTSFRALLEYFEGGDIKIQSTQNEAESSYAIYTLHSINNIDDDFAELSITYLSGSENARINDGAYISISSMAAHGGESQPSQLRHGISDPSDNLGNNGDFYLNTTTDTLFGPKTSGAWGAGVELKGADGGLGIHGTSLSASFTGTELTIQQTSYDSENNPTTTTVAGTPIDLQGHTGEAGAPGTQILTGTGEPNDNLGRDNDMYLDTDNSRLYHKDGGHWSLLVVLKGERGESSTWTTSTDLPVDDVNIANNNEDQWMVLEGNNNGRVFRATDVTESTTTWIQTGRLEASGAGGGGFDIRATDGSGGDIDIDVDNTESNPLATTAYANTKVALSPTVSQIITQPSGTTLDVRGSFDLEDNSGDKTLDFSGTSGDIHIEEGGNVKTLYDKSAGQWYSDPTNTSGNLPTSDANKLVRAGGLQIGAISVGHADFTGNLEEALIEVAYDGTVTSQLPLNVETTDADANETFLKRNTHGEIIFSLADLIQSGDLRPATSAAVHSSMSGVSTNNVILGDSLAEGETLTVPAEDWLVLPNSVKHYLYYNHGSEYTITAPADGYDLAQLAEAIAEDGILTLINRDEVSLAQFGGTSVWQEAVRNLYQAGQSVHDFEEIRQGNVTVERDAIGGGATGYTLDPLPMAQGSLTNAEYEDLFTIVPSDTDSLEIQSINSATGLLIFVDPPTQPFTITYPPVNFDALLGFSTREYVRNTTAAPTDGSDVERPIDGTYDGTTFSLNSSEYWIRRFITNAVWRINQNYIVGDTSSYVDSRGVDRVVFCEINHLSSEENNPEIAGNVVHEEHTTPVEGSPWRPLGSSISLSTGQNGSARQVLVADGGAAAVINSVTQTANIPAGQVQEWFIVVGDGTGAVTLPASQIPAVNDVISFGTGNEATTEEYRVTQVDAGLTVVKFAGTIPAEVSALFNSGDNVNIFDAGPRQDFGQIDRIVFDPTHFTVNTEAQNIGHAHISLVDGIGGEINAQATYSQAGVTVSEVSAENRITFGDSAEVTSFIQNIGFPLGNQSHTIAAGQSFNIEIVNDDGTFSYSIGQVGSATNLLYDTDDTDLDHISFPLAAANFSVARTGTIRTNLDEAAVTDIVGGTNVTLGVSDGTLTINSSGTGGTGNITVTTGGVSDGTTTYNASNKEDSLPTLGFGSMIVDANQSADNFAANKNYVAFKPLMTGIATNGTDANLNFAVEEASELYKDHVTTREWQEARLLQKFATLAAFQNPEAGDVMYLTEQDGTNAPGVYTYVAGSTNAWQASSSGGGSNVRVNTGAVIPNPVFTSHAPATPEPGSTYSPEFQQDGSEVSVQIDTRVIANDIGLPALRAEVDQIANELSNAQAYAWSEGGIYETVFFTKRSDEYGSQTHESLILNPRFHDNDNTFVTFANLTTAEQNEWNAAVEQDTIEGFGPNVPSLIPFQILSSEPSGHGATKITLKLVGPDEPYTGDVPVNAAGQTEAQWIAAAAANTADNFVSTHETQFKHWNSGPADGFQNPIIHEGESTYYYNINNANLGVVRHSFGSHLSGSSLTPDERELVDALVGIADVSNNGEILGVANGAIATVGKKIYFRSVEGQTTWGNAVTPQDSLGVEGDIAYSDSDPAAVDIFRKGATSWTELHFETTLAPSTGWAFGGSTSQPSIAPFQDAADATISSPNGTLTLGNVTRINNLTVTNDGVSGMTTLTGDETSGMAISNTSTLNGAPINALEKVGYFLGTKGKIDGTDLNIEFTLGGVTSTYTHFTTRQAGQDYLRYFYKGIERNDAGALSAGKGIWSNKVLDDDSITGNLDGIGYINLIG